MKFRKKDFTFVIVFICLLLLCYLFLAYMSKQEKFFLMSNTLYTNHHSVMVNNEKEFWEIPSVSEKDYRIFLEYNNTYRLLIASDQKWNIPVVSGRSFNYSDTDHKAIVGQQMMDYVQKKNGKNYISFQDEDYEVIGILGAEFASASDYIIVLSDKEALLPTKGTRIVIDSEKESNVKKITKEIIEKDPTNTSIQNSNIGLSRTSEVPFLYWLLVVEVNLILLFSIIAYLRFWYESELKLDYVLRIIGVSRLKINSEKILKVFLNIIYSSIISTMIFFCIFSYSNILLMKMILFSFIFLGISIMIICIFICLTEYSSVKTRRKYSDF